MNKKVLVFMGLTWLTSELYAMDPPMDATEPFWQQVVAMPGIR